jgi:sortase A
VLIKINHGKMRRAAMARRLERMLWILGIVAFSIVGLTWAYSHQAQARGAAELQELLRTPHDESSAPIEPGSVFGRIDVDRLGIEAVIFEGVESETLTKGVGHIPGSGRSPEHKNLVLAAHRDMFFRPLKGVRVGDRINVTTVEGTARYVVRDPVIVEPSEVEVLRSTGERELTLLTCYPFSFVGSAPQRFVVHAVPLTAEAETAGQ